MEGEREREEILRHWVTWLWSLASPKSAGLEQVGDPRKS